MTPNPPVAHRMILAVANLAYQIGEHHVLHGVNLTLDAGAVMTVIGPSGSGKTTLLNLCAGLFKPTHGSVLVDGCPAHDPGARRLVSIVGQQPGLLPYLSATENVEAGLRAAGIHAEETEQRSAQTIAEQQLTPLADQLCCELSGGQQQRVALARALALRPALLVADEPTSEQDETGRELVVNLIHQWAYDGNAALVATHDPRVVAALGSTTTQLNMAM